MSDATLVLCSESYPYEIAADQTFLEHEVPRLAERFARVVVVPCLTGGPRSPLPEGVELDESYAAEVARLRRPSLMAHALRRPSLLDDVVRRRLVNPAAWKRLVDFAGRAEHARGWAQRFLERARARRVLLYTYWWTATTLGFGLASRARGGAVVATRAHGYDLYEERHVPAYIPCRARSLRLLDALLPDSDTGRDYLARRHSKLPPVFATARLGVRDPLVASRPSEEGVLRVVSCSFLNPVKRVELLVAGVKSAALARPDLRIEWTHHGTGPLQGSLERACADLPANARARFAGYATQSALYAAYAEAPIDAFVNVSSSEGTPVSIMEAIACGIPVLATAVGGNPEIVTRDSGVLLPENPTANEVGRGLLGYADKAASAPLREGSRRVYREKYDAARNYGEFAALLERLAEREPRGY